MSGTGYYNNNYHEDNDNNNQEEMIFNSPFIKKMKQFFSGSGLITVYGDSYEHHLQNSNISVSNATLWDSPHEREKQANEENERLKATVSQHAVEVKEVNDSSQEEQAMKQDMLYTASLIEEEAKKRAAASLPLSDHYMISVDIPDTIRQASPQIMKVVVNKKDNALWIKSAARGKTIYMKLKTPNAIQNTNGFIERALKKGYAQDETSALATYLQHSVFNEIQKAHEEQQEQATELSIEDQEGE
jgi:hypothetical protein